MEEAKRLAEQLVLEYGTVTWELISDLFQTYEDCGDIPPCDADELYDLCALVNVQK